MGHDPGGISTYSFNVKRVLILQLQFHMQPLSAHIYTFGTTSYVGIIYAVYRTLYVL